MNEPWRVPSRSIDVVFAITVVDNLVEASQRAHFRRELLRILKPGGWLVIEFFPPSDGYYGRLLRTSGNRKRRILKDPINGIFFKLYTRPELLRWLGDSFRPVARKEREFRVIKYRKPYRRRTTILALERKPTSRRTS
jgi:ubiquinone/menaquinone biosynthesis C-methylase UbiE